MPNKKDPNAEFYVTTFCNFAHRLSDGKPLDHNCYVIPPSFLRAEIETDGWPVEKIHAWQKTRREHKGIKTRKEVS